MTTSVIRVLHELEPTLIEWVWDRRPSSRRKFAELYFEQCFTIENNLELIEHIIETVERNKDLTLEECNVSHHSLDWKVQDVRRGPNWQRGQTKYEHMTQEEYQTENNKRYIDGVLNQWIR